MGEKLYCAPGDGGAGRDGRYGVRINDSRVPGGRVCYDRVRGGRDAERHAETYNTLTKEIGQLQERHKTLEQQMTTTDDHGDGSSGWRIPTPLVSWAQEWYFIP